MPKDGGIGPNKIISLQREIYRTEAVKRAKK